MKRMTNVVTIASLTLMLVAVAGCNQYQEKVIGTWDTDMPFSPRITLEKGGRGSMTVKAGGESVDKSFQWRLKGSNLIFTLDGKDMGGVIKSVDDKTMILHDPDVDKNITFTRVK